MGADRGILVKVDRRPSSRWPSPRSSRRSSSAEQPGLVIMGKQAIDDDCNQTGQMLAACSAGRRAPSPPRSRSAAASVDVTREVDGGLQTVKLKLPAIVTTDLRLNEPRYASAAQHHEGEEEADRREGARPITASTSRRGSRC
jgi:electron transfer flavoprotein beta subunit